MDNFETRFLGPFPVNFMMKTVTLFKIEINRYHHGVTSEYPCYTAIVIIVTSKICFYLNSSRQTVPKDAKLYLNV